MMAIAKYLPKDEFDLTICSIFGKGGYRETAPILSDLGVQCFVADFRPRGASWGYFKHLRASIRDQKIISEHGPFDIQHSLDFVSIPFEPLVARWKSRIYVYNQGNLNETGRAFLHRIKVRLADRIIAVSNAAMKLLQEYGASPDKLRRVYLGIDLEEIDKQLSSNHGDKNYILTVARIVSYKRHDDIIRAFHKISADWPQLRLLIAGQVFEHSYLQQLQQLVHELGLTERVEFLGLRTDILQLMQQAAVLVHCSESEAFGWVIVEAMAVGLPVIAAAVDGPSEIIEHGKTGFLVPVGDINMYADALRTLLNRPDLSREIAGNARKRVEEKFSARAMAEGVANVYRELIR